MSDIPLIFRLHHLPDLAVQKYNARYGGEVKSQVLEQQQAFLHLLHELGMLGDATKGSTASLRYVYRPGEKVADSLRIYLIITNHSGMSDDKVRKTILNAPFVEFYSAWSEVEAKEAETVLDSSPYSVCVEIIKEEAAPVPLFKTAERQALERAQVRAASATPGLTEDEVRRQFGGMTETAFYYLPLYVVYPFEPAAEQDMLMLDRWLGAYEKPFVVDITLQATKLQSREQLALEKMINHLDKVKGFSLDRGDKNSYFSLRTEQQDLTAEAVAEIFEEYHEKMLQEKYFEFAVRVWGVDPDLTPVLAGSLTRECTGSGKYRKLVFTESDDEFALLCDGYTKAAIVRDICWQEFWDDSWEQPFHEDACFSFNKTGRRGGALKKKAFSFIYDLRRFARLARLESMAPFFRLPIPGPEPLQTMRKETELAVSVESDAGGITLGTDYFRHGFDQHLSLDLLKKHLFVSGVPGSGKTTSIFNILVQLFEQDIPFLVFEPAKTEYRLLKRLKQLGDEGPRDSEGRLLGDILQVYTLGQEHLSPFRFNPFEFPQGITLNEHLSSLESCFRGALPISTGPLPALINEAVDNLYHRLGWNGTTVNDGELEYPSLADLYAEVNNVFAGKQYSGDVRGDLQTAIEVRLGSLLRRSVGRIFDARTTLPDVETIMQTPCVIELDGLNEEQTNLVIMFMLAQVREYVRANRRSGALLSHLIVLEEAHNIIGKVEDSGEEGGNPKVEATKYIVNFLAEVRALGEGIIIADQLPSAVAPEVIKNTGAKLAHRMVSGDDREDLGLTMLLDGNQFEEMARLQPGEAFLYHEQLYRPVRIRGKFIGSDDQYPILRQSPPDGKELVGLVEGESWYESVYERIAEDAVAMLQEIAVDLCDALEELQVQSMVYAKELQDGFATIVKDLSALDTALKGIAARIDQLDNRYEDALTKWEEATRAAECPQLQLENFWETEQGLRLEKANSMQDHVRSVVSGLQDALHEIAGELVDSAESD